MRSVIYYAPGGGLGHLTRARAVLRTLAPEREAVVVTSSGYAHDERVIGGLAVEMIAPERGRARTRLTELIRSLDPECVYLDSFPGGVVGELCDLPALDAAPVHLVARRLQLSRYLRRLDGRLPQLDRVHVAETLDERQLDWHRQTCAHVEALELSLDDPGPAGAATDLPRWLVAHSGPRAEVAELARRADVTRAREQPHAALTVITQNPPVGLAAHVEVVDAYPAAALFAGASRIVTACGFNTMRELRPHRDRHRFVPFPRPLDDQYGRARAALRDARVVTTTGAVRR